MSRPRGRHRHHHCDTPASSPGLLYRHARLAAITSEGQRNAPSRGRDGWLYRITRRSWLLDDVPGVFARLSDTDVGARVTYHSQGWFKGLFLGKLSVVFHLPSWLPFDSSIYTSYAWDPNPILAIITPCAPYPHQSHDHASSQKTRLLILLPSIDSLGRRQHLRLVRR